MDEVVEAARRVPSLFDLSGKLAVVTGAYGGLGRGVSMGLAAAGADLALVGRSGEKLEPLVGAIRSEFGREVAGFALDVTNEEQVAGMVDALDRKHGHIDVLVTCAAVAALGPALEIPLDEWRRGIRVNVEGVFVCCRQVGRVMVRQRSGKIINFSSVRGSQGRSQYTSYAPSKAAVNLLTKSLACEWSEYGINVNALAPTFIRTPLNAATVDDPEKRQAILARIPMGRLGQVWDLFGAVIFLASAASDFVTGTVLYVDGGWTAA
jgi:gluconate 5-dehydrogenase